MTARWLVAIALAGCGQESTACDDGFCPVETACGGAGVCLVVPGACDGFADRTPCQVDDRARGTCLAGSCAPGVTLIGSAISVPDVPLPGIVASVRGHPEVPPVVTNINGYYDLFGVPRDTVVLVELAYPDSVTSVTRPISIGERKVFVDVLYGGVPLLPTAFLDQLAVQLGIARPPDSAFVAGVTFDPATGAPTAGVTVSIGGTTCDGPFYFDRNGVPLLDAATDGESGVFGFANCAPGPATVLATREGVPCRTLDAPAGPIALEVLPDRLAYVGRVVCD